MTIVCLIQLEESRKRVSERTATPTGVSEIKQSKLEDLYKTEQDDIQVGRLKFIVCGVYYSMLLYHLQYLSEENFRHLDRIEMLEREVE